jgi:hypothetical protein
MPNDAIVFSDDDEKAWCNQYDCGGELKQLKDGSMLYLACNYIYQPDSIVKHKSKLGPNKNRYLDERDGPLVVAMTNIQRSQRRKNPVSWIKTTRLGFCKEKEDQ